MMHLFLLPDWNSLDSVRLAHSVLEADGLVYFAALVIAESISHGTKRENIKHIFDSIGIGFFAIAVLCEIGGYWYGERNDDLSGKIIQDLGVIAKGARTDADEAKKKSDAAKTTADAVGTKENELDLRLASTFSRMNEIEAATERLGPRADLVIANRVLFAKALEPFAGTQFSILTCGPGTLEESGLVTTLSYALGHAGAGWDTYALRNGADAGETESFFSGVAVFESQYSDTSKHAGHELVKELKKIKIDAVEVVTIPLIIPPDPSRPLSRCSTQGLWGMPETIVIRVGYNPVESPNTKVFQGQPSKPRKAASQR